MSNQVPFINREEELKLAKKLIEQWGTRRVICFEALGGIGKTRILQEIRQQLTTENNRVGKRVG